MCVCVTTRGYGYVCVPLNTCLYSLRFIRMELCHRLFPMCSEYARGCWAVCVCVCVCLLAYGRGCGIEEALSVVFREVALTGDRAFSRKHGCRWKDFWHTPTALAQTAKEWSEGRCGGNLGKQILQSEVGGHLIKGFLCVCQRPRLHGSSPAKNGKVFASSKYVHFYRTTKSAVVRMPGQ